MKFDVILANPPYDNGLHEKFSIKYFDICDGEICWVSPLSFLLGKKQKKAICGELDKYRTDIEQINGNEYFDAAIGGTMGIVYVDMDVDNQGVTFDGKEYNKSEEITQFSNDELLMEFKSIVEQLSDVDNVDNHVYASKSAKNVPYTAKLYKGYVSRIDLFAGSGSTGNKGESFYSLFSKNRNVEDNISTYDNFTKLKDKFKLYIPFKSENEGIAFYNYCKTYFCRCSLFFKKTNLHLDRGEMKSIPWFDFSDPIFEGTPEEIDMALFKKYNISQDIINHILEVLPNYYDLDLSMYSTKKKGITFNGKDYERCSEITTYSNDDLLMEFKSIVEPLYIKDNLNTYIKGVPGSHYKALYVKNPNENWYCVKIPRFAGSGNIGSSDTSFYTIFSKNATTKNHIGLYKHLINTPKFDFYIILKNIFECTNFFNYAKGYFCRICLYLNKTNIENVGGSTLKTIPMFDFSDPIFDGSPEEIDMALFKRYNINQDIIDHILEILPNYYDLDLTKYKGLD